MSSCLRLTFFASPFFCSPSLLAILSVDMPPVLSPSLALTGLSILACPLSPLFLLCMCGSNCPASIPLSLSLFPLSLTTPLPLAHRFRSGSVTWPWTPGRETTPLELTHVGPTLVRPSVLRSEEHTSELQSHVNIVCRP